MSTLLNIPPGAYSPQQEPALQTPPSSAPAVPGPSPWSKWQHNLPNRVKPPSPSETTSKATLEESPHSKQKEEMLLHKALSRSCQEAFHSDSKLVQRVREEYY